MRCEPKDSLSSIYIVLVCACRCSGFTETRTYFQSDDYLSDWELRHLSHSKMIKLTDYVLSMWRGKTLLASVRSSRLFEGTSRDERLEKTPCRKNIWRAKGYLGVISEEQKRSFSSYLTCEKDVHESITELLICVKVIWGQRSSKSESLGNTQNRIARIWIWRHFNLNEKDMHNRLVYHPN